MRRRKSNPRSANVGLLMLVATLLASGCAGPREPLSVGTQEYPTGIVLRAIDDEPVQALPVPPTSIVISPPANDFVVPVPRPAAQPAPQQTVAPEVPPSPAPVCPAADPLAAPRLVAIDHVQTGPVPERTYTFRDVGTFEEGGANARTVVLPDSSTRHVTALEREDGATGEVVRYDVVATVGKVQTTTTYTVVPLTESSVNAGLYVTSVRTVLEDGTEEQFTPQPAPGLLQLPFPATPGRTWTSSGTDPLSQTTMTYNGAVAEEKVRVDACGTPLDAIGVRIDGSFGPEQSGGLTLSPNGQVNFVAQYAFATQYGGLSLLDVVEATGTRNGVGFTTTSRSTINSEPQQPKPGCPPTC